MSKPMRSQRIAEGYVYVIAASNGYVKVGSTGGNPIERFVGVQGHSPLPLELAYVCKCTQPVDVEVAVHDLLDMFRKHGEWFDLKTVSAIEAVRSVLRARGCELAEVSDFRPRPRQGGPGRSRKHQAQVTEVAMSLALALAGQIGAEGTPRGLLKDQHV